MENKVSFNDRMVVIVPQGLDKLWTVKANLKIPFEKIKGATIDDGILKELKGFRAPGTSILGVYYAGTFYINGEKTFFNIKRSSEAVVIQLDNYDYDRVIIGVENPRELVDQINRVIQ